MLMLKNNIESIACRAVASLLMLSALSVGDVFSGEGSQKVKTDRGIISPSEMVIEDGMVKNIKGVVRGRSYSADLVSFNEMNVNNRSTVKVVVTNDGIKMYSESMHGRGRPGIYIHNVKANENWVMDSVRRVYTKIPNEDELDSKKFSNGVMASRPCRPLSENSNVKKVAIDKREFNGDSVLAWRCDFDGFKTEQYYSERLLTVTREKNSNLDVSQLENIKEVSFTEAFFYPPESYREVSLKELYTGNPELTQY